jgi:hypothetical protein
VKQEKEPALGLALFFITGNHPFNSQKRLTLSCLNIL